MWDRPAYPAAEAGRLVGLTASRVRRWLKGYSYTYEDERHRQRPVLRRRGTKGTSFASFLDLIDLLFVKSFLDHGLSLQRLRRALDEAARILGETHFARKTFFTNGSQIYLKVRDEADDLLELLSGGQWVIAPIIQELADQIDFDRPTGLARRWYPPGTEGRVVLDPELSFGAPVVVRRGVQTAAIADLYHAESEDVRLVSEWMAIDEADVLAAVAFQERLAA
jgi:uncharacterized protein (DUF433 family)